MKKKFLTLALVTTMLVSTLTGCGGSGKSDTMTVSQMFEAVLEDNGGEFYIYGVETKYYPDTALGKDMPMKVFAYDGESIIRCQEVGRTENGAGNYKLGEIVKENVNFEKTEDETLVLGLNLETDETGNNVYIETIKTEKDNDRYCLGGFSRIEIYDTTFMCFATNYTDHNYVTPHTTQIYYLIEDTESTKNKTIVWDEIGTEGILIDEMSLYKDVYAPAIQQPAD